MIIKDIEVSLYRFFSFVEETDVVLFTNNSKNEVFDFLLDGEEVIFLYCFFDNCHGDFVQRMAIINEAQYDQAARYASSWNSKPSEDDPQFAYTMIWYR